MTEKFPSPQPAERNPMVPLSAMRAIAVEAIRAVTGCPDIKGADGRHLVDELESVAKAAAEALQAPEGGQAPGFSSGVSAQAPGLAPAPAEGDAPAAVWAVENKTSLTLFARRSDAESFLGGFPISVSGGMHIRAMPVIGSKAQPKGTAVAWRDPSNTDPGQGCTYDKAVADKWPHIYRQPLYDAPVQAPAPAPEVPAVQALDGAISTRIANILYYADKLREQTGAETEEEGWCVRIIHSLEYLRTALANQAPAVGAEEVTAVAKEARSFLRETRKIIKANNALRTQVNMRVWLDRESALSARIDAVLPKPPVQGTGGAHG